MFSTSQLRIKISWFHFQPFVPVDAILNHEYGHVSILATIGPVNHRRHSHTSACLNSNSTQQPLHLSFLFASPPSCRHLPTSPARHMRFTANDVPYELWLYIAQFIPEKELCDLYPVNRALFNICMDMNYKSVRIHGLNSRSTKRCLTLLQTNTRSAKKQSQRTIRKRFSALYFSKSGPVTDEILPDDAPSYEAVKNLLNIVKTLKNVTSLDIHCARNDDISLFRHCTPFLLASWRAFGPKLRSLNLRFPLEAMPTLIYTSLHLKNLEDLSLDLIPSNSTRPVHPNGQIHQSNTVLHDLKHMPNLTRMSIFSPLVSPQAAYITGLRKFILAHDKTLTEISITYHTGRSRTHPIGGLRKSWFLSPFTSATIPPPRLKSVELGLLDFPSLVTPWALSHLGALRNSMTSLKLGSYLVTEAQLDAFLASFTEPRLERLEMYVDCLRPQVFALLEDKFVFLKWLMIHIKSMRGFEGEGTLSRMDSGIPEFCNDMEHVHLEHWKLRELYVDISGTYTDEMRARFVKALAVSMPNVEMFNGWARNILVSK
ncbi:hypothetical protein BDQ17DRAFT_1544264 [Cyathus striatus]|nr:hypothetical protein BDQ17DRAFT_1544264 [Cyathus striatus]